MRKRVLEFARLLRAGGIRVSSAELLDAFAALDQISVAEREVFRHALRSTTVKRSEDLAVYDELFDLYWSGLHDDLRRALAEASAALEGSDAQGLDPGALLERIARLLREPGEGAGDLSELARALLVADLSRLEALIRGAAQEAGVAQIANFLQVGFFARRTLERIGAEAALRELGAWAARLEAAGLSEADARALRALLDARAEALRRGVRALVERELDTRRYRQREEMRRELLLDKSLYHLTEQEIRQMRELVDRLARRIRNALSLRRRRARRGRLDLHRTLRRNLSRGGIPFERGFRRRRKERPKLVILCDVSSSVANVSRFMLQLVYSLQEAFTRIRSFVFVAELGEVTRLFQEENVHRAVERALEGGDAINVYTRSDFGAAFHAFWRDHLAAVDGRTTVLVLGDARNNYHDPRAWCLREIRSRARNVVWLNPESPGAWGFGDSVMDRYLPHCDVAEECRNLRQLSAVVDRLVL